MPEPRQRPIPVTTEERKKLYSAKRLFEKRTGKEGDWGEFLGAVALLGLVAVGLIAVGKIINATQSSATVRCPHCAKSFALVIPGDPRPVFEVDCPNCQEGMVINQTGGDGAKKT